MKILPLADPNVLKSKCFLASIIKLSLYFVRASVILSPFMSNFFRPVFWLKMKFLRLRLTNLIITACLPFFDLGNGWATSISFAVIFGPSWNKLSFSMIYFSKALSLIFAETDLSGCGMSVSPWIRRQFLLVYWRKSSISASSCSIFIAWDLTKLVNLLI